jgi:hypothetical protein
MSIRISLGAGSVCLNYDYLRTWMKKSNAYGLDIEEAMILFLLFKDELKKLIRFQVNNNIDSEVYNEEYNRISRELESVRRKRLEYDRVNEVKDDLNKRFEIIRETINSRESLRDEFDEEIFNTLLGNRTALSSGLGTLHKKNVSGKM